MFDGKDKLPIFPFGEDGLPIEEDIEPSYWRSEGECELVLAYMKTLRVDWTACLDMGREETFRGKTFHVPTILSDDDAYKWSYLDVRLVELFDLVPPRDFIEHVRYVCACRGWDAFELSYTYDSQPVSRHSRTLYQREHACELVELSSPIDADIKKDVLAYMTDTCFRTGCHLVQWKEERYNWFSESMATTYKDGVFSWDELDVVAFREHGLALREVFVKRALENDPGLGLQRRRRTVSFPWENTP